MKLLLNNGREVAIESCPMDERGDKLDELLTAMEDDKLSFHALREAGRNLAQEAIRVFNPALSEAEIKAAMAGLDFKKTREMVRILYGRE